MKSRILLSAAATFLFVLLAELLLRLMGDAPPGGRESTNGPVQPQVSLTGYFWVSDPVLGFRNRPNGSFRNFKIRGRPLVTTDALGYRNGFGWSVDADTPVVAFLGDSTTFCAEVEDSETGPSEVARHLRSRFRIRVLNAGVRGYNTVQAKRALEQVLERFPETRVAVYTYAENDLVENLNPIVYHPAKAPVVWQDGSAGSWIERDVEDPVAPPGAGFVTEAALAKAGRQKETPRVWLTNRLRARSVLVDRSLTFLRGMLGESRTSRGMLELPEGSMGPLVGGTPEWQSQVEWAMRHRAGEALEFLLAGMSAACRKRGVVFLATEFHLNQSGTSGQFREICSRAGVPYIDSRASFPGRPQTYLARTGNGYDGHFGSRGTKAFANALAPILAPVLERAGVSRAEARR